MLVLNNSESKIVTTLYKLDPNFKKDYFATPNFKVKFCYNGLLAKDNAFPSNRYEHSNFLSFTYINTFN